MLKTLIVDDEKLVRSEIIKLVEWTEYKMEIVGEAENGRAALEFLQNHEVDLMFSDLSMPGLSGMEFLRAVRERFPKVKIVVMTMHREFELIQQAIRLGAIDYITKTQLEKEQLPEILNNILKQLESAGGESCIFEDNATVLYQISRQEGIECANSAPEGCVTLGEGIYLLTEGESADAGKDMIKLNFSDTKGIHYYQLLNRIKECVASELFYTYTPQVTEYFFELKRTQEPALFKRDEIAASLEGMEWLLEDDVYQKVIEDFPKLLMNKDELVVFFYQPYLTCAPFLRLEIEDYFNNVQGVVWWYQWKEILDDLRKNTSLCLWPEGSSSYIMHKVMAFIDRHFTEDLQLSQMLSMAGMSKSSFSSLFKERTGKTFVNYLKYLRIEYAKKLLCETDNPISNIGEQVGYPDERYFRRVFMELCGVTPAAFRRGDSTV